MKITSQMIQEVGQIKNHREMETMPSLPACFPLKNLEEWKTFNESENDVEYQEIVSTQ